MVKIEIVLLDPHSNALWKGGYMHTSPFGSEQPQVCAAHRVDVSDIQSALVQGDNVADASLETIKVCHRAKRRR